MLKRSVAERREGLEKKVSSLRIWIFGLLDTPLPSVNAIFSSAYTFVCEFFLPDSRIWDAPLIHSLFPPNIATII